MRLSRSGIASSVLFHALALYGLTRWAWHVPRPVAPLEAAIVWVVPQELSAAPDPTQRRATTAEPDTGAEVAPQPEVRAKQSERAARPPQAPRSEPHGTSASATPAPQPPAAQAPAAVRNTTPPPDLDEARHRAAADTVERAARADAHRSFAFPGTIAQQRAFDETERLRRRERGLGPPLSVFDSPAKGRAGLAEEPAGPYRVHWVSDDCYVFHEPTDRFILPGLFVLPTICTRRLARTDLFVTAKPSYLMGSEERASADAETQRRDLLRRPTTGAVMPLAKD